MAGMAISADISIHMPSVKCSESDGLKNALNLCDGPEISSHLDKRKSHDLTRISLQTFDQKSRTNQKSTIGRQPAEAVVASPKEQVSRPG